MPAHFGEIRPRGLTLVISHITSPAQPSEKLPRCIRCQSLAEPLSELYWHIGDTTTRLGRVRPRSVMGENRTLAIFDDPLRAETALNGVCNITKSEPQACAILPAVPRSRHVRNSGIDRPE